MAERSHQPVAALWLPVLLAALALAVPNDALPQGKPPLRDHAYRLFQQKRYDEACPLYEKLAIVARTNGALWADLGLCELRRGRREAGQRASLAAVRYGDDAVRKNAYFNLHASGYRVRLPEEKPGDEISCDILPVASQFACSEKLWACVGSSSDAGSGVETRETWVGFGCERASAATETNTVVLSYEVEAFCGYCHMHAWECSSSKVVMPKVKQCFSVEIARAHNGFKDCGTPEESERCEIITVDPCNGRVGYVCRADARGKKGKLTVGELRVSKQNENS